MIDRGIIKWQPFNSCISQANILNEIKSERNKLAFPSLSEDQLYLIGEKIKDAYTLQVNVTIEYYLAGKILNVNGKITAINFQEKKIYLNHKYISFKQILKINY